MVEVVASSTVTILGTALATALIAAPAEASRSAADAGHPSHPLSAAAAPQFPALRASAGLITGVVDGAGGRPLTGVCVVATGPGGSVLAVTWSDGRYTFGPAGKRCTTAPAAPAATTWTSGRAEHPGPAARPW